MKLIVLSYYAALGAATRGIPLGTFKPLFIFKDKGVGQPRPSALSSWIADAVEGGYMTAVDIEGPTHLARILELHRTNLGANWEHLQSAIAGIGAGEGWRESAHAMAFAYGVVLIFSIEQLQEYAKFRGTTFMEAS